MSDKVPLRSTVYETEYDTNLRANPAVWQESHERASVKRQENPGLNSGEIESLISPFVTRPRLPKCHVAFGTFAGFDPKAESFMKTLTLQLHILWKRAFLVILTDVEPRPNPRLRLQNWICNCSVKGRGRLPGRLRDIRGRDRGSSALHR